MAKKFVRGITDIKEINKQDFDTNNVNDLLSDGEHNYIHRKKKDNSEEYHNLTNNLKTITSDNTDLLSVTNDNNSTNSATVHPKHDTQKEQIIEPANNTVTIVHGENATTETTKLKVSDELVETINNKQDKLTTDDGLRINNNTLSISPTPALSVPSKNGLYYGNVVMDGAPYTAISLKSDNNKFVQIAFRNSVGNTNKIVGRYRFIIDDTATNWQEMLIDNQTIMDYLVLKQNKLQSNTSISVTSNNNLRQLYTSNQTYTHANGVLKTYVKVLTNSITPEGTPDDEYNFIVKLNKGVSSVNFTLNSNDTNKFNSIMTTYGENNTVRISGCVFTLNGSTLTVSTTNNTNQNYVITFSHII